MDELPPAIAAVVRDARGLYLLIQRAPTVPAPGYWSPVTGRVEPGESFEDAVRRECREEVGLDVAVGALVHRCPTGTARFMLHWYECDAASVALTLDAAEVSDARWVTAAEACALEPMFPATRAFFEGRR